jgi:hypothetical protein
LPTSAGWKAIPDHAVNGGSCPRLPCRGTHLRANEVGVVCPATGQCHALIFDGVNTGVFQYDLAQLAQDVPPEEGSQRLLIVDHPSLVANQCAFRK